MPYVLDTNVLIHLRDGDPVVTRDVALLDSAVLMSMISDWMRERTTAEWTALLEPHAVPCAPILELPQVFVHPQVVHRGMRIDHEGMPMVATPMRFDGQRPCAALPPPQLDEHGDAIRQALAHGPGWPQA